MSVAIRRIGCDIVLLRYIFFAIEDYLKLKRGLSFLSNKIILFFQVLFACVLCEVVSSLAFEFSVSLIQLVQRLR